MQSRFTIERMQARILDIPTIRPHKLSFGSISRQSPVIVQVWLKNGATGFGEAATIGLLVLAEGVTSDAELAALGAIGFDGATGPLIRTTD